MSKVTRKLKLSSPTTRLSIAHPVAVKTVFSYIFAMNSSTPSEKAGSCRSGHRKMKMAASN
jgi:hypothetical protein